MIERRRKVEHNGKAVVIHDYRGLDGDAYAEAILKNGELAKTERSPERLVLIDARNTIVNKNVMKAYKSIAGSTAGNLSRTAVVGAVGIQKVFISTIAVLFKLEVRAFDAMEDALTWLTS
jgi:hypothetical protein